MRSRIVSGTPGPRSQIITFAFLTADLGATALAEGSPVSVGTTSYLVALRTDRADTGQTILELELA